VPGKLHEIARLLRTTQHLGPEAQHALAELADELGSALDPATAASAETSPLVETTAHLVSALHHDQRGGPLNAARQRLQELVAKLDGRTPYGADFARRLLDVLVDLGI
jgi:hypothetical protein